jgi:hypothetical protein
VLVAFWSPKGGSCTSVVAAASAAVLARTTDLGARVADLAGDQPAILGLDVDPAPGLVEWLAAGSGAPPEALERLTCDVAPGLTLLPRGGVTAVMAPLPAAEAGAALAVALRDGGPLTVADCGRADDPATRAVVEVADVAVVVMRGCYLGLRRSVHAAAVRASSGVVLIEEAGRTLGAREVGEVLGLPVVGRVPSRSSIARAVDAGVLVPRLPDALARAVAEILVRLGVVPGRRGAVA